MRFSFGDALIDTDRFLLERGGEPVHVEPQVFDVLSHLVHNRDRVVPKTELLDTVWNTEFAALMRRTTSTENALRLNNVSITADAATPLNACIPRVAS